MPVMKRNQPPKYIDWHNIFGRILKHRWTPLGLKVMTEYEVVKHPLKIDIVVIRQPKRLSAEKQIQLPDGIRDALREHNLVDFKSIRETYGVQELKKLDAYATHYERQEKVASNQLAVFAVSAMSPKKLLTEMHNWVEIQGKGRYRFRLSFRDILLLVPNEMAKKEANDVFELFASQKNQYFTAVQRMLKNPVWFTLEGIFGFFSQRIGEELNMSGLTLEQLAKWEVEAFMKDITPQQFIELMEKTKNKEQLLLQALNQMDSQELEHLLSRVKK